MTEAQIHELSEEISKLRAQVNSLQKVKDLKSTRESNIVVTNEGVFFNPRTGPTVKLNEEHRTAFMKLLNCFIELEIETREKRIAELIKGLA